MQDTARATREQYHGWLVTFPTSIDLLKHELDVIGPEQGAFGSNNNEPLASRSSNVEHEL